MVDSALPIVKPRRDQRLFRLLPDSGRSLELLDFSDEYAPHLRTTCMPHEYAHLEPKASS
jgi:hypothetical protein